MLMHHSSWFTLSKVSIVSILIGVFSITKLVWLPFILDDAMASVMLAFNAKLAKGELSFLGWTLRSSSRVIS